MKTAEDRIRSLYFEEFGKVPHITAINGSGSGRKYFRLESEGHESIIGTVGTDVAENEDYFNLHGAMHADGINVPSIYRISSDRLSYLQQDLGDSSLFAYIMEYGSDSDGFKDLLSKVIMALTRVQTGIRTFGTAELIRPCFDRRLVMWDLNYFKYCFLKPMEILFDEFRLEDDFMKMADSFINCDPRLWGFMYRDCQSRNIMLSGGEIYWIDFQGGRPGPMTYDVASLLWQARASISQDVKNDAIDLYSAEISRLRNIEAHIVSSAIYDIVPLRILQTLGAYGFRGIIQQKEHFIKSIPAAIMALHHLELMGTLKEYPELYKISEQLWRKKNFQI